MAPPTLEMNDRLWTSVIASLLSAAAEHSDEVAIRTPPPAPVSTGVVGQPPSASHVWVPGYYRGLRGRHVWVPGKWVVPLLPGAVWVPPVWREGPAGYLFVPGHWRRTQEKQHQLQAGGIRSGEVPLQGDAR